MSVITRRHRSALLWVTFGFVLMLVIGNSSAQAAFDPNDSFDDGVIDPCKWGYFTQAGSSIEESAGRLEITLAPSTPGQGVFAGVWSWWLMRGPFDIQIDYELIEWPEHNWGALGLFANPPGDNCSVQRISGKLGYWGDNDELYVTHFLSLSGGSVEGMTPTSDTNGKLRLTRDEDSLLIAYYWAQSTEEWIPIYSSVVPPDDMPVCLFLWRDAVAPSTPQIVISFDNFRVNSGQIVYTPPCAWEYQWSGFLPPMADESKRVFKRGSTVPIKFRITDLEGNPVPDAGATLTVYYYGVGAPSGDAEVVSTAAGDWGNQFRYDVEDDLYIFNLSTKRCEWFEWWTFEAVVTLDDGQEFTQTFSLK